MDAETLRKKPVCVLRRDAWLTELRQLEDRESLRPWLHKYGCFEKKNARSSSDMVHLDNLKELAKRFRLHKSIPNFFRDYTTEDSLVAVLKRYVRNNAAFLSLTPSVARARRAAHPQTDAGGGVSAVGGGDAPYAIGQAVSVDNSSVLDGGGTTNSGGVHGVTRDDSSSVSLAEMTAISGGEGGQHTQRTGGAAIAYGGVLSTEAVPQSGGGGGSSGQVSKGSGFTSSGQVGSRWHRSSVGVPRKPGQPKRSSKTSILLNPNAGGRKLFGHSDADTTCGMIQMSRMGLSSRQVDRIHVILRQKASTPLGVQRTSGETVQRGTGAGMAGMGGPGGSGEDRTGTTSPAVAARQGAQTAPGGTGAGSLTKQRTTAGGMAVQRNSVDDGEGGTNVEESRGGGGGDGGESGGRRLSDGVGDDHSHTLKIKAAQALFRMSLEPGGEMKLVRDGVVIALMKLINVESVLAHRLVSGCLANLTTTRDVTWELLQANGHKVLAFLVSGAKTTDPATLANVATALCRCTYEARNHMRLVTEFNAAQALCYIMQRQAVNIKIASAKGMLNMCGLSSTMPALAAKLDVWMLTLCSAMEDLARNEREFVQTFVCRGIQGLTSVPACLSRIPESGIVDLLLPLVKLNQKRPTNLARLASAVVNLAGVQSAHAQLVKQKDIVAVICLLSAHPKLVESCCVAAACLSRTRDLETYLAPLATTLVETQLLDEASVDCVAFFLQNVTRGHHLSEPAVTSWLAVEADSVSAEGRLACLSAIGHLIRHREDADTPLLQAGLMGTMHAILDEPSTPSSVPSDEPQDPSTDNVAHLALTAGATDAIVPPPASRPSIRVTKVGRPSLHSRKFSCVGGSTGSGAMGLSRASTKKTVVATQKRRRHRDDLMRVGTEVLHRILVVVTKICFSLTLRVKNRPHLMQHGLPALCAKVLQLTNDDNIQFMAVACMYSLTQSPELRADFAESGAAELALEALVHDRPGHESECLLAQLAVVAQMAGEPTFCRRLASPETVRLLMRLALGEPEENETSDITEQKVNGVKPTDDGEHNRRDSDDDGHQKQGVNGGGYQGSGGGDKSRGSNDGTLRRGDRQLTFEFLRKSKRVSANSVKVASPYLSAVRFCVVTIAEHLGGILQAGGETGRTLPTSDVSIMVEKLVQIVCSVVLTSGPDEALLGRCALVMADWSTDSKFAKEMGVKPPVGDSIALLTRSVTPATRIRATMALCNIAAASHAYTRSGHTHNNGDIEATAVDSMTTGIDGGEDGGQRGKDNPYSDGNEHRGDKDGDWVRSSDVLRDIITGGLVRANGEIKGNLIKAMNNIMCSGETRAALVASGQMPCIFELIHGYTPEGRELAAGMLYNLTCERAFHPTLLEAGITYTLLELLEPSQGVASRGPVTAPRGAHTPHGPSNPKTGGGVVVGALKTTGSKSVVETRPGGNDVQDGGAGPGAGLEVPGAAAATDAAEGGSTVHAGGKSTQGADMEPTGAGGTIKQPEPQDGKRGSLVSETIAGVGSGGGSGGGGAGGEGGGSRASLRVRRNVLGAVMNLTTSSLSHPKLDPSMVMSLLTLLMQEDPTESANEDMAGDLWVAWQAVVLQLSFVERYRSLIVYHGDGQVFQHIKLTNDPLSGKSSVMSPAHDRAYKRLIMGTMVNIACEPSLYEELEGQVQVLREFLSEYEHEASGGCAAGGSRGGGSGHESVGSRGSTGCGTDRGEADGNPDDGSMDDEDARSGAVSGRRGGSGKSNEDNPSRGRDWTRHELCGKLVSNLFSSKSLRERLSKKPVAGILVGLLCGPPARFNRTAHSAESKTMTPVSTARSSRSRDNAMSRANSSSSKRTHESSGGDGAAGAARPPRRGPLPEGCGEPRPMLYGGGDEAAAIASRFLCEMSVLYAAEGGFELPQRTFEALVKIAHYYNHNASAPPASIVAAGSSGRGGGGRGGGEGESTKLMAGTTANDSRGKNDAAMEVEGEHSRRHDQPSPPHDPQEFAASASMLAGSAFIEGGDKSEEDVGGDNRSDGPSLKNSHNNSVDATSPAQRTFDAEGSRGGEVQPPQLSTHHEAGDDWSVQSGPTMQNRQENPKEQRSGDAWVVTARALTRLWVRAVGSLCCPSHVSLWPQMIDAGILGALDTCVSSPALAGDDEGLAICSSALRNLSTATLPHSLRSDRAAACFGTSRRLLSRCVDQAQVRVDCAAAMVNFVDASHVQDLQTLGVVGLLDELCSWEDRDEAATPLTKLVTDLAVYSLSKLCTRDFVPTGSRVVATITTMMDFDSQTIKRLDDVARSLVAPPLRPHGTWTFLQPNKELGTTAINMLNKRSRNERRPAQPQYSGQGLSGDASSGGSDGGGECNLLGGSVRWEIQLASYTKDEAEAQTYSTTGSSPERSAPPVSAIRSGHATHDLNKGHGGGQVLQGNSGGAAAAAASATVGLDEGTAAENGGGGLSVKAGVMAEISSPAVHDDFAKSSAGPGTGRKGANAKHKFRLTATKLTTILTETSMAASAFSSTALDGPVNVEKRILRNPVLTAEDPPFELPWLLNHGKADRLRLFEASLSALSGSAWLSNSRSSLHSDTASSKLRDGAGESGKGAPGARGREQKRGGTDGGVDGPCVADEDGFSILTVPDDKWVSPDLPPEAGQATPTLSGGGGGGGGGRPFGTRPQVARQATVGSNMPHRTPQRR